MSISQWADIEIRRGKSSQASVSWGRRVLQAVDCDDFVALSQLMDKTRYPEAKIDTQTNSSGYADYLWTILVHNYLGDTALHFALRQKRLNCVYMLLLLEADPLISNAKEQTPAMLCEKIYGQSYQNMKYDARRRLINASKGEQLQDLPSLFRAKNAEEEAWRLMKEGRLLYSELPKSLQPERIIDIDTITDFSRKKLSFNFPYATKVKRAETGGETQDSQAEATGEGKQNKSNATAKAKQEVVINEANLKWRKMTTDEGHVYFFKQETGESSWDVPEGWSDALDMSDVVATTKVSVTTNANNTADSFDRIVMSMGSKKGKTDSTHLAMSRFMASRDKVSKIKRDSNAKKMKLMIEDVWNKGTVTDVAQLIERQKRNFELRIKPPDQFIAKGLSLLETVRVGNVLEQTAAKENMLQVGRRDIVWEMPDNLQNSTEGLKKLTFLSGAADLQKVIDKVSGSKFVSSSSMNVASNISDKIVFQSVPERKDGASDPRGIKLGHSTSFRYLSHEDDNSLANRANANNQSAESVRSDKQSLESNDLSSVEEGSKVLATRSNVVGKDLWRDITEISTYTNMKYMQIGDEGAKLLSAALKNDYVIRKLCLAHAHINDLGAISIAKAIPFIHALKYLDLSSNAICDEGAVYLAKAIEEQYFHRAQEAKSKNDSELLIAKNHAELKAAALKCSVRRLSLAGNRIGMKGVLAIINTVLKSHKSFSNSKAHRTTRGIDWCSIRNNKLHNVDKESIVKLLEESNFVLENNISHWKNSYFREDGQHRYVLYRHHNRRGALHRNMVISTERDRDRISRVFLSPKTRKNNQLEEELSKEDSAEQYQSVPSNLASRDFNSDVSLDKGSDLNQDSFLSASSISELRNSVVERKTSTTNHARTRGEDDLLQDVESMTESSSDRMSSSHSESSEDGPQEEIDTSLYRSQLNRRIRKILCVIII